MSLAWGCNWCVNCWRNASDYDSTSSILDKFIHSHNFIHRDIKPQNIVMGTGEFQGTVFLNDFGIAKQSRYQESRIHILMQESHVCWHTSICLSQQPP